MLILKKCHKTNPQIQEFPDILSSGEVPRASKKMRFVGVFVLLILVIGIVVPRSNTKINTKFSTATRAQPRVPEDPWCMLWIGPLRDRFKDAVIVTGSVFITGSVAEPIDPVSNRDVLLIKYTQDGVQEWKTDSL